MSKERPLSDIEHDLHVARESLRAAEQRTAIARNEETTARNYVNDLQKEIDQRVVALRKSAPRDTDWSRSRPEPTT